MTLTTVKRGSFYERKLYHTSNELLWRTGHRHTARSVFMALRYQQEALFGLKKIGSAYFV